MSYWTILRHNAFAEQFCNQQRLLHSTESTSNILLPESIRMSDALRLYLSLKAKTKDKRFSAYANRAVNYLFAGELLVINTYLTIREPMPMHLETS